MVIGIEAQRIFRAKKHGIEIFALELIKALQLLDKTNTYYIFVRSDVDNTCLQNTENFTIVEFGALTFGDWEQIHLPRKCKEYKIEVLHLTGNTAPVFYNCSSVQTVHDLIFMNKIDFGGTSYQNFGNLYRRLVVSNTIKKATKIATVSNFEKERIVSTFSLASDRIQTVYNGISDDYRVVYSDEQLVAVKEKYRLPAQFALFLGNTSPRKNAKNVLDAFAEYYSSSDKTTKLVTPALNATQISDYLKEADNQCDESAFVCPGFIDKADLPILYQACRFLIFPSLAEGFGLPIIEAMAMGCPVLTSDTTSMPEVAGGTALLVNPVSKEEIRNGILQLDTEETSRKEMSLKGKKRAEIFSWEYVAKAYKSIYESIKG